MEKKVFNTSQGKAITEQTVFVDSNTGDDNNPGTKEAPFFSINKAAEIIRNWGNNICCMKINPGIYVLDHHVSIATEKDMTDRCIVIEASILPDDPAWTPEKMPVIASRGVKGEFTVSYNWVVSLLIDASHVTKKGEVTLRLFDTEDKPLLQGVDEPLPVDYLHVIPGSPVLKWVQVYLNTGSNKIFNSNPDNLFFQVHNNIHRFRSFNNLSLTSIILSLVSMIMLIP